MEMEVDWRMLERQAVRRPRSRTPRRTGKRVAAMTVRTAMTTSISIRVKARAFRCVPV